MILKDKPDSRDKIYVEGAFPPTFDLKKYVSKVENQGALNNCTNETIAYAMEILLKQFKPKKYAEMSRYFVWWNVREIEGNKDKNEGVYSLRNLNKVLEKFGNCYEAYCNSTNYRAKPSTRAYKNAAQFRVKSYERCTTIDQIKTAIANGLPVCSAMLLRDDFGSGKWEGNVFGSHALLIVGYTPEHAILLNSWGERWSGDGYIEVPWGVLMRDGHDFWTITGIKNWFDKLLGGFK